MQKTETYIRDLDEYSKLLLRLRNENSSLKIKNDSLSHAKLLVTNLFAHAQKEIDIYTSSLCKLFYLSKELTDAYKEIKEKDVFVKILIQYKFDGNDDEKVGQKDSIKKIKESLKDQVEIKFLNKNSEDGDKKIVYKNDEIEVVVNNFTVVDGISFRYERQETEKGFCEKSIEDRFTKAIGCMNDSDTAMFLKQIFEENFANATPA